MRVAQRGPLQKRIVTGGGGMSDAAAREGGVVDGDSDASRRVGR